MNILEQELENIIAQYSQTKQGRLSLLDRGLSVNGVLYPQVRIGDYGVVDLIYICGFVRDNRLDVYCNIYELKKDVIGVNAVSQLCRYMAGIEHLFEGIKSQEKEIAGFKIGHVEVYGSAIGKMIDQSHDFVYLFNRLYESVSIYEYSIHVEKGILFKEVGRNWRKNHPSFGEFHIESLFDFIQPEKETTREDHGQGS